MCDFELQVYQLVEAGDYDALVELVFDDSAKSNVVQNRGHENSGRNNDGGASSVAWPFWYELKGKCSQSYVRCF